MGTNRTKIWFLSALILFSFKTSTAKQYESIESLTAIEGINNHTVYDIVRGQKGYIWLATDMGISRYDGFHFRNFPNLSDAKDGLALPQAVSRIYPNDDGMLYLQLQNGGMACFDIAKERYLPITFNRPIDDRIINHLFLTEQYILYFATTKGLYSAEVKRMGEGDKESVEVNLSEEPLAKGNISLLCGDEKGNLFYCLNQKTVVHYSMGTHHTTTIEPAGNTKAEVSALFVKDNHLWIGRKFEDIAFYDYNRKSLRTLSDSSAGGIRLSDMYVTDFARIDEHNFYCSTWQGLYCISFQDKLICDSPYSVSPVLQERSTNHFPIESKMISLFWDNVQNTLWSGTFGSGAVKFNFNKNVYTRIDQPLNTEINGIEEDARGYVWLATARKGVWRSTGNTITQESRFAPWTKGIDPSGSYRIYLDKNNGIWIGDEHSGVVHINPFTEETKFHRLTPGDAKDFVGDIRQFCLDSRGRMWIATRQGVVLFNTVTGESQLVVKPEGSVKEITTIAEDKEGFLWIGTDAGVKRMEESNGKYTLNGDYEQQAGIPQSGVASIYVNSSNQIFVSYRDKVIRIDGRNKAKVERLFTLNNGLSSGHILSMMDDHNGNTWVGSNSGIMTIRNDQHSFYTYLLSGYYNKVCRLNDGRLLWSDSRGLIYFDPMNVKSRKSQMQLLLSDLRVNGKAVAVGETVNGQVVLQASPDSQEEFVFNAENNNFSFYFSDMQYDMMQRKIAYRLLPDEEWKLSSLESGIHFNNLKDGKYTLQAKLIYPDASEGEMQEVVITVKGFWWRTAGAIIGYILLTMGILAVFYRYGVRPNLKGGKHLASTEMQSDFEVIKEIDEAKEEKKEEQEKREEKKETEVVEPRQEIPIKASPTEEKQLLAEEEQAEAATDGSDGQIKKTILIVEDYKDIRLYLKTLFEREYNVLLAINGNEGVDMARQYVPDIIISDIMMPEKDGYECCREIKEGLDTCHIPIILLTAKVEDEDVIKGLEIGADDYILKPFTPKILKAKVKNLIEGRINLKNTYTRLLVTPLEEDAVQGEEKETKIEDPFISTVVKIVEENLREPDFSVKKLASDMNMSQPTLYRKVKQCTDFTITELIRGVRMKRAATLLKKRQYQVQEVAEMVGYNDIPTFRKHFIDTYGTPPSTFADSDTEQTD